MPARLLGVHMPTGKGLPDAIMRAAAMGCTAVQVFTSSPRMWKSTHPSDQKIADFKNAVAATGIRDIASHDTYLVNLCHPSDDISTKSLACLKDELVRCANYGIPLVVSHMGALMGRECADGLKSIAQAVKHILQETPDTVTLCMETTAGQGSSVNSRFEELADLIAFAGAPPRLGICLDTCHIFAAGYEMRTREGYEATFEQFNRILGLDRLKIIHCNDSKKDFGSRVDRHENIGKGKMGLEPFRFLVNDPRFKRLPIVLETPMENEGHVKDLEVLKSLISSDKALQADRLGSKRESSAPVQAKSSTPRSLKRK